MTLIERIQDMPTDEPYPRDLFGYGAHPPDPRWPGGARIAVQFVVNFEEGGENNILHGDAASEAFLSEIIGASAYADARHMSMESIYEFGTRVGFWRLHRLFTERGIPVTVFGVAMALERHPPQSLRCLMRTGKLRRTPGDGSITSSWMRTRNAHIERAIKYTRTSGERPLGWYTGRDSPNTRRLVQEAGGFLYDSDSYADELPYWVRGTDGPHLVVPYTLDANDMRFATAQGFNSGLDFERYLIDTFDVLYSEGARAPRMMNIGLHCRIVGRPGRFAALQRFVDHAARHPDVWF